MNERDKERSVGDMEDTIQHAQTNMSKNISAGLLHATGQMYLVPIELVLALYILIMIITVVGNATVVVVVLKKRGMQTFTNYLILNLALADLSTGLIFIPLDLPMELNGGKWIYGKVFCHIFYPMQTSAIYGSVFTLVIMSASRYWAIMHPFRTQPTVGTAKIVICFIWLCSVLVVIPYTLVLEYDDEKKTCTETWNMEQKRYYTLAIFIFQYCLPLAIITAAYSCIFYEIALKNKSKSLYEDKGKDREANRLIRLLLIITITFALCIMPYHAVALLWEFGSAGEYVHINDVFLGCYFLLYLNSGLNPFIYNIFSSNFREAFMELYREMIFCYRQRKASTEERIRDYTKSFTMMDTVSFTETTKCFSVKTCIMRDISINGRLSVPCEV